MEYDRSGYLYVHNASTSNSKLRWLKRFVVLEEDHAELLLFRSARSHHLRPCMRVSLRNGSAVSVRRSLPMEQALEQAVDGAAAQQQRDPSGVVEVADAFEVRPMAGPDLLLRAASPQVATAWLQDIVATQQLQQQQQQQQQHSIRIV